MSRRLLPPLLLAGLLLASLPQLSLGADEALPLPDSMVAVGDSISQAASTGGVLGADAPQNSWSTGTSSTVNSHYLRLLALGAPISGANHNLSVSGAKVAGLNAQMQAALAYLPDYLTLEIGGNDLCTDTVAQMTSVSQFRADFVAALTTLMSGSAGTHVFVASIPDAYQLWNLFKDNFWARFIWSTADICQSLLANPTSTQQTDVNRRLQVRQRNIDFNAQLAEGCALFARCRFDGNAVFDTQLTTSDVAPDYFHPSISGQAKLAAGTWAVGYTWAVSPPPEQLTWVGGLSGTTTAARNGWSAAVTVLAVDANGPLAGVAVTGSWSAGKGATACTTGGDGRCSLTATQSKKAASVTFTVTGLTRTGWTYDANSNTQTSISLTRP
jgi:lysophospholipase L1-like esterase